MGEAVKELAGIVAGLGIRMRMRLRNQVIATGWDVISRRLDELKCQGRLIETGIAFENESRDGPKPLAHAVELRLRVGQFQPQPLMDVFVKVFED